MTAAPSFRLTCFALHLGLAVAGLVPFSPAGAQQLRIALREDPDLLDPTISRTFVGQFVFAGICDKLFDINEKLELEPRLATGYRWEDPQSLVVTLREGVRFHDGEVMDAEAVRYSLNRHLTMQGSFRRAEIGVVQALEVVDPRTIRIRLREPSAPFLSLLANRPGMIVSPRAAEAAGKDFGLHPVCAGPFRFVERVAQSRIVAERFAEYWDPGRIHVQRVTWLPIPDSSVRLANLQAGAVELAEIAPSDVATVRRDRRLRLSLSDELGYQSLLFNLGNGPRADTPLGRDPRLREAFELALDRDALNQVVFEGLQSVDAQPMPAASPYHIREFEPRARDVERARQLLRDAGVRTPLPVEIMVPNGPELRQVSEVMQAMLAEAGFDLRIKAVEFATSLQAAQRGDFETYLQAWSGRPDPDGNIYDFFRTGAPSNDARYSNPEADRLLDAQRRENDQGKRLALLHDFYRIALHQDRSRVFLWHRKNIFGMTSRLQGYAPNPDGVVRVRDLRLD